MEFFDKLGKKASEAYKITADKTGKLAKETKNKLKMSELKSQVSDIYEEIGKKVYEKHVREEETSIKEELEEECTKIDALNDEIEVLLNETLELKDKKQCKNCYKQIEKDAKFCPECGAKQEQEPDKEQDKEQENNQENEQEQKTQDSCPKTTLEKTVEVEIAPQIKEGESTQYIESEED